jgi:phenol hydroxylase P5 protein
MSYQLTIEPIGRTIEVEEGQDILDACLRAGVWMPHACCHGLCATCKVQIKDGEVEHGDASPFALMDFEKDEGKTLACCATLQSDVVIEADIDDDPDAQTIPVRDFAGVVAKIVTLSPTIKAFYFQLEEALPFQAGQYINLQIPTLDTRRAFSLANPPSGGALVEVNVRVVPGGAGTTYLHEQLQVGDAIQLSGPYGRFLVRKSAQVPLLFMAGGSGLSSPRSMVLDLLEENCALPITLVYGQRTRNELYYHEELLELARTHANFHYVPVLSGEPEDSAWTGQRGFVHDAARQHFNNDFRGHKAYLCGPPVMIDACITTLIQGRLFERDIYTEKFLSAADAERIRSPLFKAL